MPSEIEIRNMSIEKYDMFKNRLLKNYKHRYKQAKRQNITCWHLYDHDLPEFPICIELYEDYIYISEYNRRHGMSDEDHDAWLIGCKDIISEMTQVPLEKMYLRVRKRM